MKQLGWWICVAALAGCAGTQRAPEATAPAALAVGDRAAREACIDGWLRERGLNEYGDPADTMYAGGTPLFDETTGESRDRIEYLLEKHPALVDACP